MEAETQLSGAMLRVCSVRPYLATALWAMRPVPAPGLGTLAVDAEWRLFYDPETVLRWEAEELAGVVYHEVAHLLRDHAARGAGLDDPRAWNLACDAEINDDLLLERQFKLPGEPILPATLDAPRDLLAEEYYERLQKSEISFEADLCAGRCGGCAGGEDLTSEYAAPEGIKTIEAKWVRHLVAAEVKKAAKRPGTVHMHWVRWADAVLHPKVDWRSELRSAVRQSLASVAGCADYTYRRPSRRQSIGGRVVLPSLHEPVPRVAVVIDTSGSMRDDEIATALGEVEGVLRALGKDGQVTVLSVDAKVHNRRQVTSASQIDLIGGGGTDMAAGIAGALEARPRPDVVVVITDGFTPWPATAPAGVRVVVATTTDREGPAWARSIRIGGDE
jgi:predicted metal-dependent peptidase